jgi:hypothetical protein
MVAVVTHPSLMNARRCDVKKNTFPKKGAFRRRDATKEEKEM